MYTHIALGNMGSPPSHPGGGITVWRPPTPLHRCTAASTRQFVRDDDDVLLGLDVSKASDFLFSFRGPHTCDARPPGPSHMHHITSHYITLHYIVSFSCGGKGPVAAQAAHSGCSWSGLVVTHPSLTHLHSRGEEEKGRRGKGRRRRRNQAACDVLANHRTGSAGTGLRISRQRKSCPIDAMGGGRWSLVPCRPRFRRMAASGGTRCQATAGTWVWIGWTYDTMDGLQSGWMDIIHTSVCLSVRMHVCLSVCMDSLYPSPTLSIPPALHCCKIAYGRTPARLHQSIHPSIHIVHK
jgi:hypothetical protein